MIAQPHWQPLASGIVVPARPPGLWTRVIDYVSGPRKIKIVADPGATWALSAQLPCGPEGAPFETGNNEPVSASWLFPAALRGAMIGKLGGSAADNTTQVGAPGVLTHPSTVPTPFPVGSFCVLDIGTDKKDRGPLFLTINDGPAFFANHDGQIVVSIFWAL